MSKRLLLRAGLVLFIGGASMSAPPRAAARMFAPCSICVSGVTCDMVNPSGWCDAYCPGSGQATCNPSWPTCPQNAIEIYCWAIM